MATGMTGTAGVTNPILGTEGWWAAQGEADEPCRAQVQAYDLARSYLYGIDYALHFAGRLDEHLRDTGITLPIRLGDRELVDDGSGGFTIRRVADAARRAS